MESDSAKAAVIAHETAVAREMRFAETQVKAMRDKFAFPPLTREREAALRRFLHATKTVDIANSLHGHSTSYSETFESFVVRLELCEITQSDLRFLPHWRLHIDTLLKDIARNKALNDYDAALKEFEGLPKPQLVSAAAAAALKDIHDTVDYRMSLLTIP